MVAFEHTGWQRFIEGLTETFAAEFPVTARVLGPEKFLRAIHENANAAQDGFGLEADEDVEAFVRYCFRLGSGMDADIPIFWVGEILRDSSFVLTSEKMSYLESEFLIYEGLVYRPEGAALPFAAYRAYARYLAEVDMAAAAQSSVVSVLERIWPERAALCSFEQMRDFSADTASLADGYGLWGDAITLRYTVMAFVLGTRFDMDPLHPWAAEILRDDGTAAEETMLALERAVSDNVLHPWIEHLDKEETKA